MPLAGDAHGAGRGRLPASDAIDHRRDSRDSIAQASAIQLLRDRFAAYPEVRSFLAAYDEPHRTVQDKVAALLTPTRHHVISRAQHARTPSGATGGGLQALGFGVLKALPAAGNGKPIVDDDGNQLWTSSFVLSFPARPHVGRAGPRAPRPSGSERSSSGPSCSPCTVTPHIVLLLPRVSFPLSPQRS